MACNNLGGSLKECKQILAKLIEHKCGWVFKAPMMQWRWGIRIPSDCEVPMGFVYYVVSEETLAFHIRSNGEMALRICWGFTKEGVLQRGKNLTSWTWSVSSVTDPQDAAVLRSLKGQWGNTPPSWDKSDDPCESWDGVACDDSRVISLGLSSLGLTGQMSGDIGGLSELTTLDLSYNPGLTGAISRRLGDLQKLTTLTLSGCSFTNNIPSELGNLSELTFLALNTNNLTGEIPPSLGKLSNLYWLDLAENQLTGSIPVSPILSMGLNKLKNVKHFHFNRNQLSGVIPDELFGPDMAVIHVLFDGNQFEGNIPSTVVLVQSLEVLRLDRNNLNGSIPLNLNNLTKITELNLAHNMLSGPLPDLTGLDSLNYVDLSNNSFDPSDSPDWFSTLKSLNTLVIEFGQLQGSVPPGIFSLPEIQQVKLSNNGFDETLNMTSYISPQLQLIDLQNNSIPSVTLGEYKSTLMLYGNPVCSTSLENTVYCQIQEPEKAYSTSLANCGSRSCDSDEKLNPQSCECAFPYQGTLNFRAPSFRTLSNVTLFRSLESSLWLKLGLPNGSVSLQNPFFNVYDYLQVDLALFPTNSKYFNRSEIRRLGFMLSNQIYKPPNGFGPYIFVADQYNFEEEGKARFSKGMIAGVTTGCAFLVLVLAGLGLYALWQKRRAEQAESIITWPSTGKDNGGAPQLKGAHWFSHAELKKCTNNFSDSNQIGSGGYGKVYKGTLSSGQVVAIKRAQEGSMQGSFEFKNEIELLSRVHHKNLVGLIGFCFEHGEQMLVYEYMANGTLRESLTGKRGIQLDWKRRIRTALGSARGIAYLHELANPPIIHRDIKSTNILLDENLTAKVADFGLSKLVCDASKGHVSTQVKGTLGYLDPEYYMTQQLTEKSDVYSFGVVMLELITSKQPIEKGKYIVREVRIAMDKNEGTYFGLKEIIDPSIRDAPNLIGFSRFLEVAMQCVEESASDRPTMSEVVKSLESILLDNGLTTTSTSQSSSLTEFGSDKDADRHPYDVSLPRKDGGKTDDYECSDGFSESTKVQHK
ncbi:putative leucine-rich repeat receptor-like protein kinase-like [Dorcoceras hygrometricum]|uniref:non-specific serine/threonine protein kinase n=1 Tax=Dorcoceras hygrometricum TaxID=472368 RepID=A0A2Z7C6Z9_9LAMI|nr:putative leucine-rich repeat receptor-like protein kinase-like [Dorcoceras hygrometricum]